MKLDEIRFATVDEAEQALYKPENLRPLTNGSWFRQQGSLMFRVYRFERGTSTVADALKLSTIEGREAHEAPHGAFHWWDIPFGDVALDLDGHGTRLLTSGHMLEHVVGKDSGWTSFEQRSRQNGNTYVGWSMDYAGQRLWSGDV